MSRTEQRRTWVLTRLLSGEVTLTEAAELLGLTERSIRRLRARLGCQGPAALVHGNRGRVSPRRLPDAVRERILELAADEYAGLNDSHLADLLAEREGITIGRSSLQRLLREAGRPSPRKRRSPRHRRRRDRMPREGLLLQTDGSRHDWLEGRGPLAHPGRRHRRCHRARHRRDVPRPGGQRRLPRRPHRHHQPLWDTARHLPRPPHHLRAAESEPLTLEEQLVDSRVPTQLGRTFARARHRVDRGPQSPGQGSRRAALGYAPGPPRRRAPHRRASRTVTAPTPSWLASWPVSTVASCVPAGRPGASLAAAARRHAASSASAASSTAAPSRTTAPCARGPRPSSCQRGPRAPVRAGQPVELQRPARWAARRLGRRSASWSPRPHRSMRCSSAPSLAPGSRSGPLPRSAATATRVRRTIPGAGSGPGAEALRQRPPARQEPADRSREQLT